MGTSTGKKMTEQDIYSEIFNAILSYKLRPGTKLTEENLSSIFNTSRGRIRSALLQLSKDSIVDIKPNKGAFVGTPSIKQAKEIISARRLIEPEIVKEAIMHATENDYLSLRQIVDAERDNIVHHHNIEGIQLGGDFHLMLASISKNQTLTQMLTRLVPQTSLVIVQYEAPDSPKCSHDEHFALLDAMQSGETVLAMNLMREHIDGISSKLKFTEQNPSNNLREIFNLE